MTCVQSSVHEKERRGIALTPADIKLISYWDSRTKEHGCPIKLGDFWFWPGAKTMFWKARPTAFTTDHELISAQQAWNQFKPGTVYLPPFIRDMSSVGKAVKVEPRHLANETTPQPWTCWEQEKFSDCHKAQYAAAVQQCGSEGVRALYGSKEDCITKRSRALDHAHCVKHCPPVPENTSPTEKAKAAAVKVAEAAQEFVEESSSAARWAATTVAVATTGALIGATIGAAVWAYQKYR